MSDPSFTIVSSKGQIVIPASLRDKLGIKTGTRISIREHDDHLVLQPITEAFISSLRGSCKGKTSLVDALQRERRLENQRENAKVWRSR